MKRMIEKMKKTLSGNGEERTRRAMGNIALSVVARGVSILSNLLIVPLTLGYVNETRYGIWMTCASMVAWLSFFDVGLGNGMRNRFAEARAKGDDELARQYLSTTYAAVGCIVAVVFAAVCLVSRFADWASVMHVDASYGDELSKVFLVLSAFFCMNMVAGLFGIMLVADQRPGLRSLVEGGGQLASLVAIYLLTRLTTGSLLNLALFFGGVPAVVMLITSLIAYRHTRYRRFAPSVAYVRCGLVKDILDLGIRFFIIYLCLILVFQMTSLIIIREIGPEGAASYQVAQRYFNILYMAMVIILSPVWSAFTDAYTKRDFPWMKRIMHRLEVLWLLSIVGGAVMLGLSPWFYGVWVGRQVSVPFLLSVSTLVFIVCQTIGAIYMHMVNGIGTIFLQTVVYVAIALVAWPCMVCGARWWGVSGVLVLPTAAYALQAIIAKIQLHKILNGTATGLWSR